MPARRLLARDVSEEEVFFGFSGMMSAGADQVSASSAETRTTGRQSVIVSAAGEAGVHEEETPVLQPHEVSLAVPGIAFRDTEFESDHGSKVRRRDRSGEEEEFQVSSFKFQVSSLKSQVFGIGCPRPRPLSLKRRGWRFVLG